MYFDTTRGKRISRLPKPLQPFALAVRNALRLPGEINKARRRSSRLGNAHERSVTDALALAVEYVHAADVDGDLAEFGTMTGATAVTLSRATACFSSTRSLHLFDSFQGLPDPEAAPDRDSFHVRAGVWKAGSCQGIDAAELRRRCRRHLPDERIAIHAGWFSDTAQAFSSPAGLALLHLDCDLYQSAIDVLAPCFERKVIQEGAIVLFDDWNCNRASPAFGVRKAWAEMVARFSVEASDEGSYGWGARKFIVHSYRAE
jgi:O-methyltransferase